MQDFCKHWRFNESHKQNQRYKASSTKIKSVFNLIPENQSVVSSIQPIVFISSVYKQRLTRFKWNKGKRNQHNKLILVHTLNKELHLVP